MAEHLKEKGIEVVDVGSDSGGDRPLPLLRGKVAGAVARGEFERGILICSTGIGMSIVANKFQGIRAALCTSTYMAKMTRQHNNSNVLCLGGKITGHLRDAGHRGHLAGNDVRRRPARHLAGPDRRGGTDALQSRRLDADRTDEVAARGTRTISGHRRERPSKG